MSAPDDDLPALTVVVPTRDRAHELAECISALAVERETLPLGIVVVDDGSVDPGIAARVVAACPGVRLVRRPGGGVAAARNTGVAAAGSPFVCFIDDDCVPDPGWAAALHGRLVAGAEIVAGRTVNGCPGNPLAAASQLAANALLDGAMPAAPGSNLACRREVALAVPFDESYARIGGEDRDWYARIAAAGYSAEFAPDAVVFHRPALNLAGFWRKHVRYGRGAYRFRRAHRSGRLEPPRFYARLIAAGFGQGVRTGFAVCLAQLATALGFAAEGLARKSGGGFAAAIATCERATAAVSGHRRSRRPRR